MLERVLKSISSLILLALYLLLGLLQTFCRSRPLWRRVEEQTVEPDRYIMLHLCNTVLIDTTFKAIDGSAGWIAGFRGIVVEEEVREERMEGDSNSKANAVYN